MPENHANRFNLLLNRLRQCYTMVPRCAYIHTCDRREEGEGQLISGAGESGGLTIIDGLLDPAQEAILIGEVAVVLIFSKADKTEDRREDMAVFGGGDSSFDAS